MRLLLPSGRASLSAFGFGKRRRAAMGYYVGLDVSLKSTHICVLDGERRVVWRGVSDTQIAMIAEHLARWGEQIELDPIWWDHGGLDLRCNLACPFPSRIKPPLAASVCALGMWATRL